MIGRSIKINDTQFTVAGVMPAISTGGTDEQPPDMWLPVTMQREVMMQPSLLDPQGLFWLHIMGEQLRGQAEGCAGLGDCAVATVHGGPRRRANFCGAAQRDTGDLHRAASLVRAAFPICASNIPHPCASLMGAVRPCAVDRLRQSREFSAGQISLTRAGNLNPAGSGATRGRIVGQILTEALLLGSHGRSTRITGRLLGNPRADCFHRGDATHTAISANPDRNVLGFTFLVAVFTGIAFGIVPALRISQLGGSPSLAANARNAVGRSGRVFPRRSSRHK